MSIEEEELGGSLDEEAGEFQEEEGSDEEPVEEEQGSGDMGGSGTYNSQVINEEVFEELHLPADIPEEVQSIWAAFLTSSENREAAGEAIYAALFVSAPSLQGLFKTPRAVMAMRLMNGFSQMIGSLGDPKGLKMIVETFGFQHLDLEVTSARVVIFRDAIVDLLQIELGARFTPKGRHGFLTFLNYAGGSFIYVRVKFAERLKLLSSSWAIATKKEAAVAEGEEGAEGEGAASDEHSGEVQQVDAKVPKKQKTGGGWNFGKSKKGSESGSKEQNESGASSGGKSFQNTTVPTTYQEMFMFNAAVMGFGGSAWMNEVLASFDTIVTNVANSYRLQEECDVLSLRIAKYKGAVNLNEYKAVMLASLRSLIKDWGSQHEVSWSWLWENVSRMIQALRGKPAVQEKKLAKFFCSLDEDGLGFIRREVYAKFFALAPAGQEFFKQSTTRLHWITDKVVAMTLDIYKQPNKMVEDISALGLRHVGYGIPTELFGPFVTAWVQVIRMLTEDDGAEEAFRWSLSLISRILTRVINEGSTIVMKAINANSGKMLKKAVGCSARGKRALWMLNVQVGTHSISPLMWAIETGSLDAAKAIIVDLLTIRADRDRYYYGMDTIFERHPDIIKRLCLDAPALLPTLLDGLIWRSRTTESGQRRVNYYIQHLLIDGHGEFAKNTEWITNYNNPKLVCHPIVSLVTDLVWTRVAIRTFLLGKAWFLFTLIIFVLSQAVLNHLYEDSDAPDPAAGATASAARRLLASNATSATASTTVAIAISGIKQLVRPLENRLSILAGRCFIYICSMGQLMFFHCKCSTRDFRNNALRKIGCLRIPEYLCVWQGWASLVLTMLLVLMVTLEPILHCYGHNDGKMFAVHCAESEHLLFPYSVVSTVSMLFYFLLLSDLSVFSTRVSAFALVCSRLVSEVFLFLFGLCFFVLAFACAVSTLEQEDKDFEGIPNSALQLVKITFGMFSGQHYESLMESPPLLVAIFIYVVTTVIFLLNLLIAQLNCSYQATYQDMLGYARLNRGKIVIETMPSVAKWRWNRFLASVRLEERVEFGEGDLGLSGGVQVWEPASANVTTVDMIRRFGGSTSPGAQWPEEEVCGDDEEDRFDRMEKLIEKAMKRMGTRAKGGSSKNSSSMDNSNMAGSELDGSGGSQMSE